LRIIVRDDLSDGMTPSPANPGADVGVRFDVEDPACVTSVLGDDPASAVCRLHADDTASSLAGASSPCFDEYMAWRYTCPGQRLHRRIE
jgi:hypothetical protein